MIRFTVPTAARCEFVEITDRVAEAVAASGVRSGLCVVYIPHTTAGVTIQENADPDVVHDMLLWFERIAPHRAPGFRHAEGNSDSHIKASLVGSSATLIIEDGLLHLGTWQGVYLCEFDGPRRRSVSIRILGN
ncbi:MAG: secondary thiamine-phosphate synthase enzyme YjbQ [Gemmataceae bacterium]|nr:YjbQ family protein [Planctomycetia bacterium]MBX3401453.1 secondary thiamine-phosphate synthase enzyme YjbQ [Gemmataceae bacterium]